MPRASGLRAALFMTSALGCAGLATAAFAQAAPTNNNAIEEVVVTATRQTSTVNKVALSVSAVTQKNLDQQGIRSVSDLSNQVPGFTFRTTGNDNNPNLTLRGVGGNALNGTSGGAPTTGLYVDDVPMMSRNANGLETGSGTPLPLIYDLDRIEVLRGPQGTLYGGSSEGGTIRFILPQPSLTTYSGTARVGWSTMQGGGMGNEEGLAIGGPIIQDKLGFRVSGYRKDNPGWVDNYSMLDGHQFAKDVNWGNDYSLRGSVLWQVTPSFKATVSVFHQMDYTNDNPTVQTSAPAMTFPTVTYRLASGTLPPTINPTTGAVTYPNGTGVNGVAFSFPARVLPGFTVPAQTWLGEGVGTTNGRYLTPTNVQYVNSPRRTIFTVPSLSLDYNWDDKLDFKSITAYEDATTGGWTFTGGGSNVRPLPLTSPQAITKQPVLYGAQPCPSGPGLITPILTATCNLSPRYIPQTWAGQGSTTGPADSFGYYFFNNRRGQTSQEFRVSTTDPSWRLQFVLGAFIQHVHNHVNVGSSWNEPQMTQAVLGVPEQWLQGTLPGPVLQVPGASLNDVSTRNIDITEDEQSVFGEFTFAVTSKFKITAGVRAVNYNQQFLQIYGGTVASAPPGWVGSTSSGELAHQIGVNPIGGAPIYSTNGIETNPNSLAAFAVNYAACPQHITASAVTTAAQAAAGAAGCPYQYTYTKLRENPVTPKVGASYQLTPNDMLYVTYAEGYRPGGINPFVPPVMCAQDLANLGVAQSPATYARDSVKSTEVGGKFRLFGGQAQINAAAFHITWDNVQFVDSLPTCAFSFTTNAASAASDGGEIQFTGRTHGFTLNANIAYDNARYTKDTRTNKGVLLVAAGNNLGVPDWTANVGLQYDTRIMDFPAYARMDYAYTGKYMRSTGPGTNSFNTSVNPNFVNGNETHLVNARVGVYYKDLEIAGYVTNLFNSQEWINKTEGLNTYYYSGIKETPRIIGVQMNYRF